MSDDPRQITYVGVTDFRNQNTKFGIRAKDRLRHIYVVGATGVGKSVLLENLCIQDIQNGNGVAILDPHGTTAEKVLDFIPEHRIEDVIYFAPFDLDNPLGFNPLEDPGPDLRYQVADGLLAAFKKIWPDAFSARMEYILSMTLLALLEYPESTLLSVNRMLADKPFRMHVLEHVKDPSVRAFWIDEFNKWEDKFAREASAAIQNKVGQFTSNPLIRNILGQPKSTINFRQIMDEKKIFIANLSKGRVGEQNAPLLGAMLITKIYLAAMSRADKTEYDMNFIPPFFMFVDEFQNFANDSFENILSESRKYKLSLTVAHQYIEQMPDTIKAAVFGNVGTKIVFRTQKAEDAEMFEKIFAPVFVQQDIINLQLAQIYLTLMIDGVGSQPFSARTLPPAPVPPVSFRSAVLEASRRKYTRPRADVEKDISAWYAPSVSNEPPKPRKIDPEKDAAHKAYLDEKRAEVERRGGVWLDPAEYKAAKENNTLDDLIAQKKKERRSPGTQPPAPIQDQPPADDVPANAHDDQKHAAVKSFPNTPPQKPERPLMQSPGIQREFASTAPTGNKDPDSNRAPLQQQSRREVINERASSGPHMQQQSRIDRPYAHTDRDDRRARDNGHYNNQTPSPRSANPGAMDRQTVPPVAGTPPPGRTNDRAAMPSTQNSLREAIAAAMATSAPNAVTPVAPAPSTAGLTNKNQTSQYKEHDAAHIVPTHRVMGAPEIRQDDFTDQSQSAAPLDVSIPAQPLSTPRNAPPATVAPYNAWSEVSPEVLAKVLQTKVW